MQMSNGSRMSYKPADVPQPLIVDYQQFQQRKLQEAADLERRGVRKKAKIAHREATTKIFRETTQYERLLMTPQGSNSAPRITARNAVHDSMCTIARTNEQSIAKEEFSNAAKKAVAETNVSGSWSIVGKTVIDLGNKKLVYKNTAYERITLTSSVRTKGLVRISQRQTLAHWLISRGRSR